MLYFANLPMTIGRLSLTTASDTQTAMNEYAEGLLFIYQDDISEAKAANAWVTIQAHDILDDTYFELYENEKQLPHFHRFFRHILSFQAFSNFYKMRSSTSTDRALCLIMRCQLLREQLDLGYSPYTDEFRQWLINHKRQLGTKGQLLDSLYGMGQCAMNIPLLLHSGQIPKELSLAEF